MRWIARIDGRWRIRVRVSTRTLAGAIHDVRRALSGAIHSVRRALAGAALVVLMFHTALHTVWGSEMFLYSQHWHAASLLLVAVNLEGRPRRVLWVGTAILGWIALHNLALMRSMLERLAL